VSGKVAEARIESIILVFARNGHHLPGVNRAPSAKFMSMHLMNSCLIGVSQPFVSGVFTS
jgi:hypothetical protein